MSVIGALAIAEPELARERIRVAMRQNGGNTTHAAGALNVSHRHLCRLIDELGLGLDVDKIRRELGVVVVRPGEAKRSRKRALRK
jgi:DNA-binding NtrC family response regulator